MREGVSRLQLTAFRSYKTLDLKLDPRPVVLSGVNGAGKTNILEALSFLAPGRGLRKSQLLDISHKDNGHSPPQRWAVSATVFSSLGERQIGTGLEYGPSKERRVVKIEGKYVKNQSSLNKELYVSWLTPQMDRLFMEGAKERRRFLDRLVYGLDAGHAERVARYDFFTRERLKVLMQPKPDPQWLSTLEEKMAAEAIAIVDARVNFLHFLSEDKNQSFGNFPKAQLSLKSNLAEKLQSFPALHVEEALKEELHQTRTVDREVGRTSVGAHKDDLIVFFVGKGLHAEQCSTGEQKAMLLSIIMAAARIQSTINPGAALLLLDEVVAHLDESRRQALFEEILNLNIQAWMTGTDADLFKNLDEKVQHFQVKNAIVRAIV